MNPTMLISAIVAAVSFGTGWHLQTLRYTAKEAENEQQKLAQVQQSAATAIRQLDNVLVAQNASSARAVRLRGDLDSSRSELDRLRTQLAKPMPRAEAATSTCPDRADPARELLAACAAELQDLAGKADRHANDALMLQQAWPK